MLVACPAHSQSTGGCCLSPTQLLCVPAHADHKAKKSSSGGSSNNSSSAAAEAEDEEAACATHPGMKELQVRASSAFDAPDVLTMFVGEMRQQAQDLKASIVTLVAPKAAVSFPQVCGEKRGL